MAVGVFGGKEGKWDSVYGNGVRRMACEGKLEGINNKEGSSCVGNVEDAIVGG
jgi:hypothetical protein